MGERLVIRGGRVVDGTGAPSVIGDVEVVDGRIMAVGALAAGPGDSVDATGLVVAPGFIDIHTHYDAQLMFEPTATPASWHGVTTVVTTNTGFGLAPAKPGDMEWLARSLAQVEGMSPESLLDGVTFPGGTTADFAAHLDGRVGVNVVPQVGHTPLRRYVMGEAASERQATDDEVAAMQALLDQGLRAGAFGFASAQLDQHRDHENRPVPSNRASAEELVSLASVLGAHPGTTMEFVADSSLPGLSPADEKLLLALADASGGPVNANIIDSFPGYPDGWRHNLAVLEAAGAAGRRLLGMWRVNPQDYWFALDSTAVFNAIPALFEVTGLPDPKARLALSEPGRRARIRHELATTRRAVDFEWDRVFVDLAAQDGGGDGGAGGAGGGAGGGTGSATRTVTVAGLAAERGVDPVDAFLDVVVSQGLSTVFRVDRGQGPEHDRLRTELGRHPLLMAGASDGGAHLQSFCGADYPTRLIAELVPEPFTLEAAVHRLTGQPAAMLALADRGVIRPGAAADLVLFDPDTLGVERTEFLSDFPAGARRLVHRPRGYAGVVVGGRFLHRDGEPTGDLPGRVLRRQAA